MTRTFTPTTAGFEETNAIGLVALDDQSSEPELLECDGDENPVCPCCKSGRMIRIEEFFLPRFAPPPIPTEEEENSRIWLADRYGAITAAGPLDAVDISGLPGDAKVHFEFWVKPRTDVKIALEGTILTFADATVIGVVRALGKKGLGKNSLAKRRRYAYMRCDRMDYTYQDGECSDGGSNSTGMAHLTISAGGFMGLPNARLRLNVKEISLLKLPETTMEFARWGDVPRPVREICRPELHLDVWIE
jgi:hypothetical protein